MTLTAWYSLVILHAVCDLRISAAVKQWCHCMNAHVVDKCCRELVFLYCRCLAVMHRMVHLWSIWWHHNYYDISDIILFCVRICDVNLKWHVVQNWPSFVQSLLHVCMCIWPSAAGVTEAAVCIVLWESNYHTLRNVALCVYSLLLRSRSSRLVGLLNGQPSRQCEVKVTLRAGCTNLT